jgi:hypothetical protein
MKKIIEREYKITVKMPAWLAWSDIFWILPLAIWMKIKMFKKEIGLDK